MGDMADDADIAGDLGFGAGNFTSDRRRSYERGGDKPQPDRWRCLITGCNPVLNETTAAEHKAATGHRVARWPVRSARGKRLARERNQSGYYDKYNVGDKSYERRLG